MEARKIAVFYKSIGFVEQNTRHVYMGGGFQHVLMITLAQMLQLGCLFQTKTELKPATSPNCKCETSCTIHCFIFVCVFVFSHMSYGSCCCSHFEGLCHYVRHFLIGMTKTD